MNLTLYRPSTNCCDITKCFTSCPKLGHLTTLGWVVLVIIVFIISFYIRMRIEK